MTIEEVDDEDSPPITPPRSCHVTFNISNENTFFRDNVSHPSTSTEPGPPPEEHEDFTYIFCTPTSTQPQNNVPSTLTPGLSRHTDLYTPTPSHCTRPTHTPSQRWWAHYCSIHIFRHFRWFSIFARPSAALYDSDDVVGCVSNHWQFTRCHSDHFRTFSMISNVFMEFLMFAHFIWLIATSMDYLCIPHTIVYLSDVF